MQKQLQTIFSYPVLNRSSKHILVGFGLVLVLMIGVMAIGLWQMSSLSDRLEAIVAKYNARAELVVHMRNAARERLIVMHAMAIEEDLFARDDLFQRFQQHAVDFVTAREKLLAMHLNEVEAATLERQSEATRISVGLQERFLDLIIAERYDQANNLFLEQILPAQNKVLAELDELLAMQRDASQLALDETTRTYRYTIVFMVGLGGAAIALALLVAVRVMRTVAKAEDDVFNEKELAEVTLHSIGDAVITADASGRVTHMNARAEKLTGWFAHEAIGLPLERTFHAIREVTREPIDFLNEQVDLLDSPSIEPNNQALLISRDGQEFAIETSLAPIRSRDGKAMGLVLVFRDVTKSRFLAQQLSWHASHDALTGLANRPEFQRRLTSLLDSAKTHRKVHSLLYLDLDQFKVVNDTCGHGIGDELLRQLAAMLETKVRKGDTLARLGGDEFGVLLENCPLSEAERIAENLRDCVRHFRFAWMDRVFEIGVSIGVVGIDVDSPSPSSVLSAADTACYAAKDRGRNRVHVYQPHDKELARREGEMQWTSRITTALEEGRMSLRFQRIVPLGERETGEEFREVLLEMMDESGVAVRAPVFLPAAERYGLMPAVDRWVIKTVLGIHEGLVRSAQSAGGKANVIWSINLSGNSLNDDAFLDFLLAEIDQRRVPPTCLCFEITETAAITNLQRAEQFIRELKKLGCRFALDDFGNGMSSFVYLKNLSVDFLKIDGSFVKDMAHDPIDLAMVEAINRIGHVMGIKTIAECVEDESILDKLRALGVDFVQGDALHKPEPLRPLAGIVNLGDARGARSGGRGRQ